MRKALEGSYCASRELCMTRTQETKLGFLNVKVPVTAQSHLKYINKSCVTANYMVIPKQENKKPWKP